MVVVQSCSRESPHSATGWLAKMPSPIALEEPDCLETDAPITCIDTCRSKPLILTGSSDGTVCIFDHQAKRKLPVLTKSLPGALTSVALHPSGLAAAYGFGDQVVLAHILDDDLRPFLELPATNLSQLGFNHGGNVLAVVHGDMISLYDFTKTTKICDLGGKGLRLVTMVWSSCDTVLYTLDEASTLTRWSVDLCGAKCTLECLQRLMESSELGARTASIALPTKDKVWFLSDDSDGTLQTFSASSLESMNAATEVGGEQFTAMAASSVGSGLVFVGVDKPGDSDETSSHVLRVVSSFSGAKDSHDIPMSGSISQLHVADDNNLLIVAGTSESKGLSVYTIADCRRVENKAAIAKRETLLISEKQFDELSNAVINLERDIRDAELDHEFNIRRKENAIIADIEKARTAYHEDTEDRAERLHSIEMDVIATRLRIEREQREMALRHADEVGRLEDGKQGELSEHVRTSKATEASVSEEMSRIEQERRLMAMEHQDRVQSVRSGLKEKFRAEYESRIDLEKKLSALEKELGVCQDAIEEELDAGVESMKRQYSEKLGVERDDALQLMSSNGILKKKIASAMAQIESNKDKVKNQLTREEDLKRKEALLQKQSEAYAKKHSDKASVLEAKNNDLADLRKRQRDLEETITNLGDRSNHIAAQIDRRCKDAANIDLRSETLSSETDKVDQETDRLGAIAVEMQEKVVEKSKTSVGLCRRIAKQDNHIQSLLRGLEDCRALVQRPSELAEAISALEREFDGGEAPSGTSPHSTEEPIDEENDSSALKGRIGALEDELSDLLRQQAIAEKQFKCQRDAVRQVNEKMLQRTSVPMCK